MHSQFPVRNISSFISRRELSSFSGRHFEDSVLSSSALYAKLAAAGGDARGFTCAAFDESGDYLAVGREDASILLIDYPTRKNWALRVSRHTSAISGVSFQPRTNGTRLISAGFDRSLVITDPVQVAAIVSYDCLTARARRIAHEDNPHVFFTGSEEGCVRMFDLREKHQCDQNGCRSSALLDLRREKLRTFNLGGREVVSKSMSMMDITGLAINPAQPNHLALGCNDPVVRIYDRRMLRATGLNPTEQVSPIHKFLPAPVIENNKGPLGNVFVNDLRYNHDGSQLLASYNGHGVFILDSGSLVRMSNLKDAVKQLSVKKKRKASALSAEEPSPSTRADAMEVDTPNTNQSIADDDYSSEQPASDTASRRPKKKRKVESDPPPASAPQPEPALPPPRLRAPASTVPEPRLPGVPQNIENPSVPVPDFDRLTPDMFLPANLLGLMSDPRASRTTIHIDDLLGQAASQPAATGPAAIQQVLQRLISSIAEAVTAQTAQQPPPSPPAVPAEATAPNAPQSPFPAEMIRDLTRAIMMETMNAPIPTGLDEDQPPPPASSSSSSGSQAPPKPPKSYSDCDGAFLQHLQGHLHFERDLKDAIWMGPKSEYVATGSEDGNLFIWSSTTGSLAALITRGGTTDNIRIIAAPTRTIRLASIGHSTLLNVWTPTRSEKIDANSSMEMSGNGTGKTATAHEITEICSRNIAHMRDNAEHRRGRPRVNVDVIRLEEPMQRPDAAPPQPAQLPQPPQPPAGGGRGPLQGSCSIQ